MAFANSALIPSSLSSSWKAFRIEPIRWPIEIASGLLKMVIGNSEAAESIDESFKYDREERSYGKERSGKRDRKDGDRRDGGRRESRGRGGDDMSRLFINIGKNMKVLPKDIVGAIAGETGIPGKSIGEIAIFDKYCFVEVPKKFSDKVINIMNKNQIKGNKVAVQLANERQ